MRLSSDFWCSALIKQIRSVGAYAYLTRRGAAEAGAIFILMRLPLGLVDLYGPAPQSFYDQNTPIDDRQFIKILSMSEETTAIEKLEKELRFDADLWLLEIEDYKQDTLPFIVIEA